MTTCTETKIDFGRDTRVTIHASVVTPHCKPVYALETEINPLKTTTLDHSEQDDQTGSNTTHDVTFKHKRNDTAELDFAATSAASLKKKHHREYTSWRAMHRRAKNGACTVETRWDDFEDFFADMGPMPAGPGYTLDRINNELRVYGPGKCRWATKQVQNSNKSDTNIFVCSITGQTFKTADLARKHKVQMATIRQWKKRGWTDREIIAGKRASASDAASAKRPPKLVSENVEAAWVAAMTEYFPKSYALLTPAGRKMLGQFEMLCQEDAHVPPGEVISVLIANWFEFTVNAATENGLGLHDFNSHLPEIPQARFVATYPAAAINFWAHLVDCKWSNGRPV